MCNSPMSTETSGHSFDTNQNETMEKSTLEWNEQLEKEIFSGKCMSVLCSDGIVTRSNCSLREFCAKAQALKTWLISSRGAAFCCLCLTAECPLQH